MGNRQSKTESLNGGSSLANSGNQVTPDAAAYALGGHQIHPEDRKYHATSPNSSNYTNPLARAASQLFNRITGVFASSKRSGRKDRRSASHLRRSRSFAGIRESSPLCMDDGRDSIRSRSPLSPRIVNPSVANGQKEDAAQRTEHPRLGIEMAEIDKGPELGVEAQTLLPLETTEDTPAKRLSDMSIDSPKKPTEEVARYPFLDDTRTVEWIKKNAVMVVMRGLPGSGKSFLVDKICSRFGTQSQPVAVHSADHYFIDSQGGYQFDRSRIKDAHEECFEKTTQSITKRCKLVVVDNTNVEYWEMKKYFKLASCHGYRVIIAEPKTSWKLNHRMLAKKNKHGVSSEVLEKRVKLYQKFRHIRPMYFGWFLGEADSKLVMNMAYQLLAKVQETSEDFREDFGCDTSERLFNQDAITDKSTLHCTAKFFSRNEALDKSYLKTASEHCSQVSAIKVSGFVISGRTFGAKVDLSEDQMSLYRQDDYEIIRHTLNPSDPQEPNGNKAHLTIGTKGKEVRAMETGLDTLRAMDTSMVEVSADLGELGSLWRNPDGLYYLKLNKAVLYDAIFTGHYV